MSMTAPSAPPPPVRTAVRLTYVMAALSVLGILLSLGTVRASTRSLDPAIGTGVVAAALVFGVIIGVIVAAVWVLFGVFTGRGRNWARIVLIVLASLTVLSSLTSIFRPSLGSIASILELLTSAGIIYLLGFRPEAKAFFARRPGYLQDPAYPGSPGAGHPQGQPYQGGYPQGAQEAGYPAAGAGYPQAPSGGAAHEAGSGYQGGSQHQGGSGYPSDTTPPATDPGYPPVPPRP